MNNNDLITINRIAYNAIYNERQRIFADLAKNRDIYSLQELIAREERLAELQANLDHLADIQAKLLMPEKKSFISRLLKK